jgi:alcohol dehydrogenase (cytochrome c)
MRFWLRVLLGVIVAGGIAVGGLSYAFWDQTVLIASMAINYMRYRSAPPGTLETEVAQTGAAAQSSVSAAPPSPQAAPGGPEEDWPSYNKTLTSNRFSQLSQINRTNADKLKVLCTYDTRQYTGFNSGLLKVNDALIFATAFDIFSIDPSTCRENWRTHEDYTPATPQEVNRGAAYLDGMLFRGTQDARVLAYDIKTGKRIWETVIGDPKKGESAPAAPIAWNGLVFIGNAGGDIKGVKGRMYALDAKTGKIVWEFYLVPKAEGDPTRGPQGASPLNTSTWGNSLQGVPITGGATWTSYTLDPDTGLLYVPGGNPAPDFAADVREGSNLYSGSVVVLDAMTGLIGTTSRSCRKTGTIGMFPALQRLSRPRAARRCYRSPRRTATFMASISTPMPCFTGSRSPGWRTRTRRLLSASPSTSVPAQLAVPSGTVPLTIPS